jgi:hypothetical protein
MSNAGELQLIHDLEFRAESVAINPHLTFKYVRK